MKRWCVALAAFAATLVVAGLAQAQLYHPPFPLAPAPPETMPTWQPDELSGTARHNITATPGCGAANPQGGIPSMATGNCP